MKSSRKISLNQVEAQTGTANRLAKFATENTIGDSQIFDNGTNVGIGTDAPKAKFEVKAQSNSANDKVLAVRNTTNTQDFLVVNGAGDVYNKGANVVISNTFFGENVGRFATNINNSAFGRQALQSITSGFNNTAFGASALRLTTTAGSNSAFGNNSLGANTTGANNSSFGSGALALNTTSTGNNAFGVSSLASNTIGVGNCAFGVSTLQFNTTGSNNIAIGNDAGAFIANGSNLTNSNNSIFIGLNSRALDNNQTNQIVIGRDAIGKGSNTVQIGNAGIQQTHLQGQIIIGIFATAPTGVEGAIYYDSTKKKHRGFNGTTWNDLY